MAKFFVAGVVGEVGFPDGIGFAACFHGGSSRVWWGEGHLELAPADSLAALGRLLAVQDGLHGVLFAGASLQFPPWLQVCIVLLARFAQLASASAARWGLLACGYLWHFFCRRVWALFLPPCVGLTCRSAVPAAHHVSRDARASRKKRVFLRTSI